MRTAEWPPCIVTLFDLVGTGDKASSGVASSMMLRMHQFAVAAINGGLSNHDHGYVWNDSVLLLSYKAKPASSRRSVLMELSKFKFELDQEFGVQTYAISVQGLAFPQDPLKPPAFQANIFVEPRAIVLKTSSWAMANCFSIEKALGTNRADWYIDSRITNKLQLPSLFASKPVDLLPKGEQRDINMYKGYLHVAG